MKSGNVTIIESILACPHCLGDLRIHGENMWCCSCGSSYKKKNGKYYFREVAGSDRPDPLDRIKGVFKKYEKGYRFLVSVVAPTFKMVDLKKFVSPDQVVVIDLGSGNTNNDDRWIRIDFFDYPNVDIVCDCERLPIKSGSVDVHYNVSVLEHLSDPVAVVAQIHRTLKNGGIVISSVPFLVPYHASPHDYQRFTSSGILNLFKGFTKIKIGVRSGPFSALLWITEETLASLLSFGSQRLRRLLLVFFYLLLFPLKLLDLFFLPYPTHSLEHVASNFYFIGRKE
jgi:SAM-dependent methyltransferase